MTGECEMRPNVTDYNEIQRPSVLKRLRFGCALLALGALGWLPSLASANPDNVVICLLVTDNHDATNNGGQFNFSVSKQDQQLGSFSLTQYEGLGQTCSAPIVVPGDATELRINQDPSRPGTWPRNGLGYPQWNATSIGISPVPGTTDNAIISGTNFTNAAGTLTVVFNDATGRQVNMCVQVEDNGDEVPNQGGTWNLAIGGNSMPVAATEGQGVRCNAAPVDIPVANSSIGMSEQTYGAATGFPKFGYTTTGGQSNADVGGVTSAYGNFNFPISGANYAGTSGDFTVTVTNRYADYVEPPPPPPQRTFNVCAQIEGDGNSATGPARTLTVGGLMTGINGTVLNWNVSEGSGLGVRGPEACAGGFGFASTANISTGRAEISRYAGVGDPGGAWNGNAPGYPKWELVNVDTNTVLVNGEGDAFVFNAADPYFNSYPNLKVRFVLRENSALGAAGGSPVLRVCNRMLDNGNGVAEDGAHSIYMNGLAANKPSASYSPTEGGAPVCTQTWPALPNSSPAGPAPTLDGNLVPGFPDTPAVSRALNLIEGINTALPWVMATGYPIATIFADAAGTQPLTTPVVATGGYTMPISMNGVPAEDAYLFIDNKATTATRNYQVCVNVVGSGSTSDARSLDFYFGLSGNLAQPLTGVPADGDAKCSALIPGAPFVGNSSVSLGFAAQAPAGSDLATPYNVTSSGISCTNGYSGSPSGTSSSNSWAQNFGTYSRSVDFTDDSAVCSGDVTVNFTYTLARTLEVCTQTLNNGDQTADNANIGITLSYPNSSRWTTTALNTVEGAAETCVSVKLRRAQPGNWDGLPIVVAESGAPSFPPSGMTSGFPVAEWESENGLSGLMPYTGTQIQFDYNGPLAGYPNAIHGTKGKLKVTFLNRAGAQRQVTFCQRVENNGALPDNQGGSFSVAGEHNSTTDTQFSPLPLTVTEQAGQAYTEVCGPTTQIPNLATMLRSTEAAPPGWVSASGYPKWQVVSDSGQGSVESGVGNETGDIDLSSATLTGNPKVIMIDRAAGPVITHTKQVASGPTAVAGQPGQYDITYQITVTNTGELPGNYSIDDLFQFDSDVSIIGTPTVSYSGGGSATPTPGFNGSAANKNLVTNQTLANGGTDNFDVTVRFSVAPGSSTSNDTCSGGAANGLFNLATINPPTVGQGPDLPVGKNACANTPGVASLTLAKTAPASMTVDVAADYSLSVTNTGAADAANATVHDLLPAHMQYNSAAGAACSATGVVATGQLLTCTVTGPLVANGAAKTFTVNVTPQAAIPAGTSVMNRASVDRAGGTAPVDPSTCTADDAATGCAVANATIAAGATDIQVTKTPGTGEYLPGQPITWTITATNAGPNLADGVTIADAVPTGLTAASWTCVASGGATCAATGTGNINDTVNLPANGNVVYTLHATTPASATADIVNTATATLAGTQVDTNPANNTATSTFSLQKFDVGVVKQKTGDPTYVPGAPIEYTITLNNAGPADAVGIAMADTVPGEISNVRLVSCVPSAGSTCGTTAVNGNAVTASDIAILNGGTVVFAVSGDMSATATQTVVNTATITGDTVTGTGALSNTSSVSTGLEPQGILKIVKATNPAGATDSFAFTTTGTGIRNFNLSDGNTHEVSLRPGNYTVTETATPGWVLNSLVCVDPTGDTTSDLASATSNINLGSGETVTCTYSNFTVAKVTAAIALTTQSGQDDAVAEPAELLTYTATFSNAGATAATNFAFDESVPAGATLTSITGATPATGTRAAACSLPVAAGTTCALELATVPANGTATVTMQYTVDNPLPDNIPGIVNTIGNGDLDCSLTGSVCSTALLPARAHVILSKALTGQSGSDMAAAEPGEVLTYTLTISNPDAVASKDFTFTENVPAGATLTGVTGATGCAVPVAAGGQCALDVPSIAGGSHAVVTVQFTMDNPIPSGITQVTNRVTGIDDVCARTGSQCEATIASRQFDLTLVDDVANTPQNKAVKIPTLANDNIVINGVPVQPDQITLTIDQAPSQGTVVLDTANGARAIDGGMMYTPSANFSGTDSFTYKVCDAIDANHCATATVTVTVEANVIKVVDDTAEGKQQSGAIAIPVLDNDSSMGAPLDPASVSVVDMPASGLVSCAAGVCSYTPNDDFFGTDRFTYRVCDSSAPSTVCGNATVTIEVAPGIATLRLSKITAQRRVKIGDLVRYTVTVENVGEAPARAINLVDRMPAGFTFVDGSLSVKDDDNSFNVSSANPLRIANIDVAVGAKATMVYMLRVGAGVGRGAHINRIVAVDGNARTISNEATATVELDRDPLLDESLIIGKVFEDLNDDGVQQKNELGMPGVRIASVEGLIAETDAEGRYHLLGIEPASSSRGSNFILKLDSVTLPPGSKLTTPNPLVRRITPGVPVRFDFGVHLPAKAQPGGAGTTDQPNAASDAGER